MRACAARTAQLLNYSEIARDVDISVMTATAWLSVLIASFQVFLLPSFQSNITKRLVKAPKLYFPDTGPCAFLTGWTSAETLRNGAMRGPIVETYVVSEVLKSWWFQALEPALYYHRDKDGSEIDLIVEKDNMLYPIEVKSAATVKRDWAKPFRALDRLKVNRGRGAVLCLADDVFRIDERVTALPIGTL